MYNRFELAKKFICYYWNASNGKGHGIHSPFVYDFIENVLTDNIPYPVYQKMETLRKDLLEDRTEINVEDFGAGSLLTPARNRQIKDIAHASLKPKKYAQLLYRIAKYYKSQTIIELGTSLGITTCYLAAANRNADVITLEGSANVASKARQQFQKAGLNNITLIEGNFSNTIPSVLCGISKADLLFIDGNHRKNATIEYFQRFLEKTQDHSIFIFDDIHWSAEMEEAWADIQKHPAVTLSIDLFFIGLVFFSQDFKVKQDFTIRF